MIRDFIKANLPVLLALALSVAAFFAAWNWLTGLSYRTQAAALKVELAEAEKALAGCEHNAVSRLAQIQEQNAALEQARTEAERRRQQALETLEGAKARVEVTRASYDRLRRDWPAGCVQAVARIRQEYDL